MQLLGILLLLKMLTFGTIASQKDIFVLVQDKFFK